MPVPFTADRTSSAELAEVVAAFEEAETELHQAQAKRAGVLARAQELALREASRGSNQDRAEFAYRTVRAELAIAARVHERTLDAQLQQATTLVEDYPRVHALHSAGFLSAGHIGVIIDAGIIVQDPEQRLNYESAVIALAIDMSVAELRPHARRIAERFAEQTFDERHQEARAARRIGVSHGEDGMSCLRLILPTLQAKAIHDRTTRMGHALRGLGSMLAEAEQLAQQECPAQGDQAGPLPSSTPAPTPTPDQETRTMDQLRADIAADLLIEGEPSEALGGAGLGAIRAHVSITAPITTALGECLTSVVSTDQPASRVEVPDSLRREIESAFGLSSETVIDGLAGADGVAHLAGCGPIDTNSVQHLLHEPGQWSTIRVHPRDGSVLSVDSYRPSAQMRRFLGARDQHCRFPGCTVPVARCDLDHTVDWALGGKTRTDSMAHLCRGHHMLRHHTPWSYEQLPGGVLNWTSPTGRTYVSHPPSRVMFRPIDTSGPWQTAPPGDHLAHPPEEPIPF